MSIIAIVMKNKWGGRGPFRFIDVRDMSVYAFFYFMLFNVELATLGLLVSIDYITRYRFDKYALVNPEVAWNDGAVTGCLNSGL